MSAVCSQSNTIKHGQRTNAIIRQAQAWGRWMWRAGAALPRSNRWIEGLWLWLWNVPGSRIGSQRDCKIGEILIVLVGPQYVRACSSHSQMYRDILVIGQSNWVGQTWANMLGTSLAWGFMLCQIVSAVEPAVKSPFPFGRTCQKESKTQVFKTKWYKQFSEVVYKYTQLSSMVLVYHGDELSWRNIRRLIWFLDLS